MSVPPSSNYGTTRERAASVSIVIIMFLEILLAELVATVLPVEP